MYTASNMLAKARSNSVLPESNRNYYRNVYLQSEHWKSIREEKLSRSCCCENCGSTMCLDVHHIEYKGLYDVRMKDLKTLCRSCHNKEHKNVKKTIRKHRKIKRRTLKLFKRHKYLIDICNNIPSSSERINIIKDLICKDRRNRKLSVCNKLRQEKFDRIGKYKQQQDVNTYISIHY